MSRGWSGFNHPFLTSTLIYLLLNTCMLSILDEPSFTSLHLESGGEPFIKPAPSHGELSLHFGNEPHKMGLSQSDSPLLQQLLKEMQILKNEVARLSKNSRPKSTKFNSTKMPPKKKSSTRTDISRSTGITTRIGRSSPADYDPEDDEEGPSEGNTIVQTTPKSTAASPPSDRAPADPKQTDNRSADYEAESWSRLKISPEELGSMPYGDFNINIYGHTANERQELSNITKRYYFTPICELNHKSAKSVFNNVSKKAQVHFRIEMWNANVSNSVMDYTSNLVGQRLKPEQIQVLPFEKVVLTNSVPSTVYEVSKIWIDYRRNRHMWFTLTCLNEEKNVMINDCDYLADQMRTNPSEQFSHLSLKFALASQKTERRETVIKIENVSSGKMMTQLNQRFPGTNNVLLTADDQKQLITETATNVIMETFDESSVVSPDSEKRIYDLLNSLMTMSKETITAQNAKLWDSVFWNEDNYRPDRASRTLTEFYKNQDKSDQKKWSESFSNSLSKGGGFGLDIKGLGLNANFNYNKANTGLKDNESLERFLNETRNNLQWEGDKVTPRPMTLTRVNTGALKDSKTFRDKTVRASYTNSMLSISIHIDEEIGPDHFSLPSHMQNQYDRMKYDTEKRISGFTKLIEDLRDEVVIHKNSISVPVFVASVSPPDLKLNNYVKYRKLEVGGEANSVGKQHGQLNLATGIFTANTPGVYMFQFYTRVEECVAVIDLRVNDNCKANAVTQNAIGADVLALSSIVKLDKGHKVGIVVSMMEKMDSAGYTQFSGTLLRAGSVGNLTISDNSDQSSLITEENEELQRLLDENA